MIIECCILLMHCFVSARISFWAGRILGERQNQAPRYLMGSDCFLEVIGCPSKIIVLSSIVRELVIRVDLFGLTLILLACKRNLQ